MLLLLFVILLTSELKRGEMLIVSRNRNIYALEFLPLAFHHLPVRRCLQSDEPLTTFLFRSPEILLTQLVHWKYLARIFDKHSPRFYRISRCLAIQRRCSLVRTSFFGRLTFLAIRPIDSRQVTTDQVGKLSAMGQLTRPTHPSIPPGSVTK